jgi:hypothetical protein
MQTLQTVIHFDLKVDRLVMTADSCQLDWYAVLNVGNSQPEEISSGSYICK